MNKTKTAIMAMVVAFVAIGMTGLAMAGSAMDYEMNFDATGDGALYIDTYSNAGTDVQSTVWTNAHTVGHQNGDADGWRQINIERSTTITGLQNGDPASGAIFTQTTDDADSTITVSAGYYDDDAYGSYVSLDQETIVRNHGHKEFMCTDVDIVGFGYGADNPGALPGNVFGQVTAVTGGSNTVTGYVYAVADDGGFDLDVHAHVKDSRWGTETVKMNYDLLAYDQGGMGWLIDVNGQAGAYGGMTYTPGSTADVDGSFFGILYRYGGYHCGWR